MTLYHYCCRHSASLITRYGFLRPNGADYFGVGLIWLTDQVVPDREGLGLTSHLTGLKCDRLERRYVVQTDSAERWMDSLIRRQLSSDPFFARDFEGGRQPETWWISTKAVWGVFDRQYQQPAEKSACLT